MNSPKSGLVGENDARIVLVGNSKHGEDLAMYIQLPYYGEFQWYDLGANAVLSQIAQKIYDNFRNPSWRTWKTICLW